MSTSDYVHWVLDAVCNAHNVLALINGQSRSYGSTYIDQYIPTLCYGVEYNLTYSFQITISGGQPGMACSVSYSLASIGELAHIGPPSGGQRPFSYQKSSYNRGNGGGGKLTVSLSCNAPSGMYTVVNVSSLAGRQDPGDPGV